MKPEDKRDIIRISTLFVIAGLIATAIFWLITAR
jgi:hypothetical protein